MNSENPNKSKDQLSHNDVSSSNMFEELMLQSKINHEIADSSLKTQINNQNINIEILNNILDEIRINNKLLSEFKSKNESKIKNIFNSTNILKDSYNKSLENQQSLDESISYLKKQVIKKIDDAVYKLDSSSRGYVDSAIEGLDSSLKGHIDGSVNKLDFSLKGHIDGYVNNYKDYIVKFINSQYDVNNDLVRAVELFSKYYDECKNYFFNNDEKLLKKYLDTDELFRLCFFNNIQFLSYSTFENKILLQTQEGITLATNNRFYTIKEIIGFNSYSIPHLYQFEDFIVFDVGMNRGYASLWFAKFNNCSAVYGFEIDNDTFNKAIFNFNLNKTVSSKIFPYNLGLSNKDEIVDLYYLSGQDGLNTMISEFTDVQPEFKNNKDKIQVKKVEVKKASEVISNIIETNNINSKIVLKIDTEGAEFNIINDLISSELINDMDIILGEGHIFSDETITEKLSEYGFKKVKFDKHKFTYNFIFVKEYYYDFWPLKEV